MSSAVAVGMSKTSLFHEAVPDHRLRLFGVQLLTRPPAINRQGSVTAVSRRGSTLSSRSPRRRASRTASAPCSAHAPRTDARLPARFDIGPPALGGSRGKALALSLAAMPMPPDFLAAQIGRSGRILGQAFAFLASKREPLARRDAARTARTIEPWATLAPMKPAGGPASPSGPIGPRGREPNRPRARIWPSLGSRA